MVVSRDTPLKAHHLSESQNLTLKTHFITKETGLRDCRNPFTFFVLISIFRALEISSYLEKCFSVRDTHRFVRLFSVAVCRRRGCGCLRIPMCERHRGAWRDQAPACCSSVTIFNAVSHKGGEEQTSERATGPDLLCQRAALLASPRLRQRFAADLFRGQPGAGTLAWGF